MSAAGSSRAAAGGAVTCPFCGADYTEAEGRVCHAGCPLAGSCQLLSCPHCGYEMPASTRTTRWLADVIRRLGPRRPDAAAEEAAGEGRARRGLDAHGDVD